jgi:adenylate cyclase
MESEIVPGDVVTFGEVDLVLEASSSGLGPAQERDGKDLRFVGQTLMRRVDANPGATGEPPPVDAMRMIRLLSQVGQTLVATLPLSEILERVVDLLMTHVPAERGYVLLRDPEQLTFAAHIARPETARDQASISQTLQELVLRDRVAVLTSDAWSDPRFEGAQSIQGAGVRSLICGPLGSRDEIIGLLYVDNPVTRQFSAADLEVFSALANYASVAISQSKLAAQVLEEGRRRERLERYHSPAVVEQVLQAQRDGRESTAEEREVTVLFADLVGFTPLTEHTPPVQVIEILNAFLSRMTDVIFAHEGTVDKFLGDAILAVFGGPVAQDDHAARAVETAKNMMRELAALNAERGDRPPLQMRIAINSGMAIIGDIGSPKRREYTVLGDVVNTASRLESTVAQPDQIVISEATYRRIQPALPVTSLGNFRLRGRGSDIRVYSVAW